MSQVFFQKRIAIAEKLLAHGFACGDTGYCYATDIAERQFRLTIYVSGSGDIKTQVIDKDSGDEYILHRTAKATSAFVGMVKADYEAVLAEIAEVCFDPDIFKSEQAKEIFLMSGKSTVMSWSSCGRSSLTTLSGGVKTRASGMPRS